MSLTYFFIMAIVVAFLLVIGLFGPDMHAFALGWLAGPILLGIFIIAPDLKNQQQIVLNYPTLVTNCTNLSLEQKSNSMLVTECNIQITETNEAIETIRNNPSYLYLGDDRLRDLNFLHLIEVSDD